MIDLVVVNLYPFEATCDKPGATLTIAFTGRKLLAYAPGSSDFGLVEVSIDGGKPHDVDLCADWAPMRQVPLADCEVSGSHTVVIRLAGRKSEKSSGVAAQFDLFQADDESYAPEGAEDEEGEEDSMGGYLSRN